MLTIVALVGMVFVGQRFIKFPSTSSPTAKSSYAPPAQAADDNGSPSYKTYLPTGKTISALGGWARVSPVSSNPVYAYTDTIGTAPIVVSQQPLPDKFKQSTEKQVEELALSYGAKDYISAGRHKVYIGTSAEGPQSVILYIEQTLILIKSSTKLSNDRWIGYINSLQ